MRVSWDSNHVHVTSSSQPFVTEVDLRAALLPQAAIEYLREAMPRTESDAGAYDYESWLDHVFS